MASLARVMATVALVLWLPAPAFAEDQESATARPAPPNPVVFWELGTHDGPKSLEFLKKVFVEPPHEIGPGTWICLFNDPSGVTFAMLEKRELATAPASDSQ